MKTEANLPEREVAVLRRLAERQRRLADDPANLERRAAWLAHDAGTGGRPMILAEVGGVRDRNHPLPESSFECTDPWARNIEKSLRTVLYQFDTLQDDRVVEPYLTLNWRTTIGTYGVDPVVHHGDNEGRLGSRRWDPPIRDLDRDFGKLHPRSFAVDRPATLAEKARMEAVFGGILPVRIRGGFYWTMGLTWRAIDLIGLESLMLFLYDNPAGLHRLMAFLRDDHLALADWLEREGLYTLNNEGDSIGSGSIGYTRGLPQPDAKPGMPVRTQDLWVLSESQETVGVGPDQFEEFVFPYQRDVCRRFGKVYYGCCEPLHSRWHVVERIPNLERVSVSPWADEEFMADALGTRYVYSRKPSPALISTPKFDENAIRADIRKTLSVARGCRIEIIMKDVHTLNEEPDRLARWVRIAREECSRL